MANDDFSEPLDTLIPKIPFSIFPFLWVWVTSEARRSVSLGFRGFHQLSPLWGGGGPSQGALSTAPLNCKPIHPREDVEKGYITPAVLGP